jgi:hypothetical protein
MSQKSNTSETAATTAATDATATEAVVVDVVESLTIAADVPDTHSQQLSTLVSMTTTSPTGEMILLLQ